jgi:hypothetical protein
MRYSSFVALALSLLSLGSHAAELVSAEADFRAFLSGLDLNDKADRERRLEDFESRYDVFYDEIVYRRSFPGAPDRVRKRRDAFFDALPRIEKDMLGVFERATSAVANAESAYRGLFSDMPNDIPVYFVPSMMSFNGKVAALGGRSTLFIAPDFVAQREDDLDLLIRHELLHAYHDRRVPKTSGFTLTSHLWREGLATVVSGLAMPGSSDSDLLFDASLGAECAKPAFVKEIARRFQPLVGSTSDDDYTDWFTLGGPTQPWRRGYCLGMHVVRDILARVPLMEAAGWDDARASAEAAAAVDRLAAP